MNKILTIAGTVLAISVLFTSSFVSSAEAKGKPVFDKTTGIKLVECSLVSSNLDCSFFTKDGIAFWLISTPSDEEIIILPSPDCLKKDSLSLNDVSDGTWIITVGECITGEMSSFEIEIFHGQISSIILLQ